MIEVSLPVYSDESQFSVERQLRSVKFSCDLDRCKGACCTMPGATGAPILEAEIPMLEKAFDIVKGDLTTAALDVIAQKGVWEREPSGSLSIPTIGERDCVFVVYEGDIAHCAIERAYRDGRITDFPKPISCHLFPIRIYPEGEDDTFLVCYEEISECSPGRKAGIEHKVKLVDFLETPLVRALGAERLATIRSLLSR